MAETATDKAAATAANATVAIAVLTGLLVVATIVLALYAYKGVKDSREDADRQVEATREDADRPITATRETADNQIAATRETADNQIAAMRETTDQQVAAARRELDAAHRPLLIEVFPSGPIYADMGSRDNPNISPGPGREVEQTIQLKFPGGYQAEKDPRCVHVGLERGMAFISVPLRNVGRGLAIIDPGGINIEGPALGVPRVDPVARRVRVPVGETTRIDLVVPYEAGRTISTDDRWLLNVPYMDFARNQRTVSAIKLGYTTGTAAQGEWLVLGVDQET